MHGVGATKEQFDNVASDLANQTGRRLFLIDMRNHGDSEKSDIFNYDAINTDIINFMDLQKIKSAVLLGHSLSGRSTLSMAFCHPNRVESIIVVDMTPKAIPRDIATSYSQYIKVLQECMDLIPDNSDIPTAISIICREALPKTPKNIFLNCTKYDVAGYVPRLTQKDGKFMWKANFDVIRRELESQDLNFDLKGTYNKPALFLYGELSEFKVGDDKDTIMKLCPKAQLKGLPTSHLVFDDAPKEFIQIIVKFLE